MNQNHNHDLSILNSKLKLSLILNTCFTIIEFIVGIFSGSLALISDSLHNLTDSFSLLITFISIGFGEREPDHRHSFGHERITIIVALFNSTTLIFVAFYIFYEAIKRILHPHPVEGSIIALVAAFGIIINGSIAFLFSRERDLHIKSAFLSMAFDTISSVGALVAGIIIFFTKLTIFDPIISICIGLMLLVSAWGIIKESLHILLEGMPEGFNLNNLVKTIRSIPLIKEVDDLHVWALSSHDTALSCHIVIEECDLQKSIKIVKEIKKLLAKNHNITHATIETELEGCEKPRIIS